MFSLARKKDTATEHPSLVLMDCGDLRQDPEPTEDLLKCSEGHMDFFCNPLLTEPQILQMFGNRKCLESGFEMLVQ